jgi:RNA polymerase sigma-70 factor (ECF subfamily)
MELLLGLTPDQRSVIALRVIADLSLEETAGILGKSVGAVKALQKRGLERLRRGLEQAVSSPSDPTITRLT